MNRLVYQNQIDFNANFPAYLKNNVGRGFFISGVYRNGNKTSVKIGGSFPEFIDDDKTKKRIVKFCSVDAAFVINTNKIDGKLVAEVPERIEIVTELKNKLDSLTIRSESALLKSTYNKMIEIPLVQTAMTPMSDALLHINEDNQLPVNVFLQGRKKDQGMRYLELLRSLGFIEISEDKQNCLPGKKLINYQNIKVKKDMYNYMLSEILQKGYPYLKEYLHLTQLLPFMRIANSYYFTSSKSKTLLAMSEESLNDKHKSYYGSKKPAIKLKSYINEIKRVEVFDPSKDEYVIGNNDLFQSYMNDAPDDCSMPPQ